MISGKTWKAGIALCMPVLAIFVVPLFSLLAPLQMSSQEKEKISEGQYARVKDNLRIQGSEQTWTLWRLPGGGYELEDHFLLQVNPADQLLSELPLSKMSRELRKEIESKVSQTDFVVRYGPDRKPHALVISGKRLIGGKTIEVEKCEIDAKTVRCHGSDQSAKLHIQQSDEFFYAFPFPMLLGPWFATSSASSTETSPIKLAVLDYGDKLDLAQADRKIESLEDETLTVGDHQFQAHKAKITLTYRDRKPLKIAAWYGTPGLIYALEAEGIEGQRICLVQYTKYSDF
jgi:hypothetical protein